MVTQFAERQQSGSRHHGARTQHAMSLRATPHHATGSPPATWATRHCTGSAHRFYRHFLSCKLTNRATFMPFNSAIPEKSGLLSIKYRIFFTVFQLFFTNFAVGILDRKHQLLPGMQVLRRAVDTYSISKPLTNKYLLFFYINF